MSILIVDYDPRWPKLFLNEESRICAALGPNALRVEHVGSTSVPDTLLVVQDSADEESYAPALERAGYVLRIRESHWFEHRMFNGPEAQTNLHVFSLGCLEIDRMLLFRDHLRSHAADRDLYQRTKQTLAQREWGSTQDYADAKTAVVKEILGRARQPIGTGSS
jgi:GrpB-like predicted nucleotidyltransferase (UPF0157 family)